MAVFICSFTHPDDEIWRRYLGEHLDFVRAQLDAGSLLAAGPPEREGASSTVSFADGVMIQTILTQTKPLKAAGSWSRYSSARRGLRRTQDNGRRRAGVSIPAPGLMPAYGRLRSVYAAPAHTRAVMSPSLASFTASGHTARSQSPGRIGGLAPQGLRHLRSCLTDRAGWDAEPGTACAGEGALLGVAE